MGLLKALGNFAISALNEVSTSGSASLKQATQSAPDKMGCYKLYYNGLKYVGKAEDGIRKRFVQYYNGTTAHYPSAKKIYEKRDEIRAEWTVCETREECRKLEAKWIEEYKPEWNQRKGWS